jgi:tRNA A37 methylthiotransferase MiaB
MLGSEVIVSYFDLSLQHVSPSILRGMGRWGGRDRFTDMIGRIRTADPLAGIRSTFIMGFPGETEADADEVVSFIEDHDLDWLGTFTYSPEEGTRSRDMDEQVDPGVARARAERVSGVADSAMQRRAESLIGNRVEVLVERFDMDDQTWTGRSKREAPEVDGEIRLTGDAHLHVGDYVEAEITAADGADLIARPA